MKKYKRLLCLLTALCLFICCTPVVHAEETDEAEDRTYAPYFYVFISVFRQTAFREIRHAAPFLPCAAVINNRTDIAGACDGIQTGLLMNSNNDENVFMLMIQPPERCEPEDIPTDIAGACDGGKNELIDAVSRHD